jgi:hypothetical protein
MGKFLRFLVVVLLLASVAALVMAHILFSRREVLRGRTLRMQRGIVRLARTLESNPPEPPAVQPSFPEKDMSPVTAEPEPSPRRADFWSNYQVELESLDQPLVDLSDRRRDLMSLYKTDPVTGAPIIDNVTGTPVMEGPGTMQQVIDDVVDHAGDQYNTLTATRQQLRLVREELVKLIEEFNGLKNDLRTEKATVVRVEGEREEQRSLKEQALRELDQAREQIKELNFRIADLEQEKLILTEEKDTLLVKNEELLAKVAQQAERISELEKIGVGDGAGGGGVILTGQARIDVPAGIKGRVVSVDQGHLFVVMEVNQTFMDNLVRIAAENQNNALPLVDLLIERGDDGERTFVSKVRLTQIKQDENLAIGEILVDWQQMPIVPGDRVLYQ